MNCTTCKYREDDPSPTPFDEDYICGITKEYIGGELGSMRKCCSNHSSLRKEREITVEDRSEEPSAKNKSNEAMKISLAFLLGIVVGVIVTKL